ncbi:MAG: oxidoreductase [Oceanospirillaceae bacterium]|nr:oxidoreductase [Oceanospirillaceae bacterium]MBT11897.1 oxidoreductase [Oceanospirillaceae bacterium]|tara:strand:+ start:10664 stop:11668 length:1005 start_codon:yes stop_codon:yes gene_type:complete
MENRNQSFASTESRFAAASTLPVIDIAGLASDDAAERQAVGKEIRAACLANGFFLVSNHGVDEQLQQLVFDQAKRFFALDEAQKMAVDKANSVANRGYEPMGNQTLEPGSPPDLKEGYYMGQQKDADHPDVVAGKFNCGPNQWPEEIPEFRPVMEEYLKQMTALGERLMKGLALSLELPEDYFADYCKDPMTTLRLLHYPPQPADADPAQRGAGAHTDFGGLTILLQDDAGGLQVWDDNQQIWLDVEPIPGTYNINLGDMFARWTNDMYRSTLHRVINNVSGGDRYSIPFFHAGNSDYVVDCLPGCCAAGEEPKYPPVTVEEHHREMYARTYGK